ncbi:tail fibers protein [Escherichia phage momo]|uniref:Tail fibers protein n=2 Tax=root TaxID=1 RepID=A0A6B9WTH7_9CAUD|nr:tail fibers protein [Escherichia phage momo]
MADYKLSELNSIDTIRSDDLLHVRVKKRPEMLGDEDRRMTYQDFLASFKLERFVQIAGSTMTGDLGIVKLLYGGKAVFDPTGSSEITMGDVLKAFKINANGLKLTIADASRSATVYHTLNKPSPNELGMRTNEENDARYARLAVNNTFRATQAILSDNEALIAKNITQGMPLYIRGQDADGTNRWYLGNDNRGTDNLVLKNVKSGAYVAILANLISVNKSIQITGQVQPSDFSNLDARYFTQTAANQRFAQLVGNNTFRGINNFVGEFNITRDNAVLVIKNATAATGLYLLGQKADGTNKFYLGTDNSDSVVNLHNYTTSTTISLSNVITTTKTVKITGQVQPSDWTNIDSRYIPAGTLSNLAKLSDVNTFRSAQIINQNGSLLQLKNTTQDGELYFAGYNADGARRWYIGNGESSNPERLVIHNSTTATTMYVLDDFLLTKNVRIIGQVQPSDWSNIDERYYNKSSADNRYLRVRSTGFNTGGAGKWAKIATVSMPQATSTAVIELFGGAGFNFGEVDQACKTEIVLRTGNGDPKGLNVVAWKNSPNTVVSQIGYVNTSGDNYDIYCVVGNYQNDTTARVQSSSNATVQLFEFPETSDNAPSDYVAGTIAYYYTSLLKPSPSDIGAYTKSETDQKIAQAVSDSTDLNKIYPVGIVTWFNSNVNPNTALPGLTWTYLNNGVGRTIRVAAANGSDVATTGGSDSVTLAVGNLPSHTHSFSATTSSFDYGTKNTNTTGAHAHSVSGSTSSAGNHNHSISWIGQNSTHYSGGGGGSIGVGPGYTDANGAHTHSVSGTAASAGNHAHSVGIGAHTHTVSGNTGGTGSGSAFSVTNQFYKLMAWVRTA